MFTIEDVSLHRGYVGFAKMGKLDINILSFGTKDPRENKIKNHIQIEPTLKKINFSAIEAECEQFKSVIKDLRKHE